MGRFRTLMRRQRNNVTRMSYELRRVVNRLLFEGGSYQDVNDAVRKVDPSAPKLHSSSLGAWQKSPEYIRYRDAREADDVKSARLRAIATAQNDGRGPQSAADVIVAEVLDALLANVEGGKVTDLGDLGAVTKAVAPILRAQIAGESAAARRREQDLQAQLSAAEIAHDEEIGKLREELDKAAAEIAALKTASDGKGGLTPEGLKKIEESAKLL